MYHPYLRGKQYELIAVRENAALMAASGFTPIIEPVKESLVGVRRAFDAVNAAKGDAILVVNPFHGDYSGDDEAVRRYGDELASRPQAIMGIGLYASLTVDDVLKLCARYARQRITLIHNGFQDARELSEGLGKKSEGFVHIFIEDRCSRLYRRRFHGSKYVLIRDGFRRRINREYEPIEAFSDLHVTYEDEGANAFGDFLIVGDEYSESGGPAYAVAIHLTVIDPDRDDEMFVHHFVSDRTSTPKDPAGKFAEALAKLVAEVERDGSPILNTSAVQKFLDLHKREHFPGLGSVKKLSMSHHIETLADYCRQK